MTNELVVTFTTNPDPMLMLSAYVLSAVVFCLNMGLIIHGFMRRRRCGSAQWIPAALAIVSTLLLCTTLTTALLRMAYALRMAAMLSAGAAGDAMLRMAICHHIQTIAASLPAVALGFIGMIALKSQTAANK